MAVLEFKTHSYKVTSKPGKITMDEQGDPVQAEQSETESEAYPCDIVESGAPNTITTQDGQLVYVGQEIQIFDKEQRLFFKGKIKGFSKKQLQTLIWV